MPVKRANGCLLGQFAGDALGSLVEFLSPEEIRRSYPEGVRELADSGTWNTIAGQPTDDSEMALLLARSWEATGDSKKAIATAWSAVPLDGVAPDGKDTDSIRELLLLIQRNAQKIDSSADLSESQDLLKTL